jgi:acyl carrier protein
MDYGASTARTLDLMDRERIRERLLDILTAEPFAGLAVIRSSVTDETSLLNDLGFESLQLLDLVVAIEQAFALRISAQTLDLEMFDRFSRLVDFVATSLASAARGSGGTNHGAIDDA